MIMSKIILQDIFKRIAVAPFFGEFGGLRHIHLQRPLCWSFGDYPTKNPPVQCASDDGCSSKKDSPSKDRPRSCSRTKKRSRKRKRTKSKTSASDQKTDAEEMPSGKPVDCASLRKPEAEKEPEDPCAIRAAACGKKRKIGKTCVDPVVQCGRKAEHKNEPCSFTVPKTAPKESFTTIAPVCEQKPKVKRTCPRKEVECRDERKAEKEKVEPAPPSSTKVSPPKATVCDKKQDEEKSAAKAAGADKMQMEKTEKKNPCAMPRMDEYDYTGATAEIPSPHIFKRIKEGSLGPDISKTGKYKNPEYFSYNKWTFYEAMIGIVKISCPQPSNKKPFIPPQTKP